MTKFEQYKIIISEKDKKIVENYLQELKIFAEKYEIDKEVLNDISEVVFEKLSLEKDLDEVKIRKILKSVGKSEDIFSDYISENGNIGNTEKNLGNGENPKIEKLSENSLNLLGFFRNIFLGIFNFISFIFIKVLNSCKIILNRIFQVFKILYEKLLRICKFFMKNIFPFLRFIVWTIIGSLFLVLCFSLIIAISFYFSNFTIENLNFNKALPNYAWIGFLTGIIASAIFTFGSFLYAFRGKIFNSIYFTIGGILVLFSFFIAFLMGFDLVKNYNLFEEFSKTSEITLETGKDYELDLGILERSHFYKNLFLNYNSLKIEKSENEKLIFERKISILGNEELSNEFKNSLSELSFSEIDGKIKASLENNITFKNEISFVPHGYEFILYVPENITIKLNNGYLFQFRNVSKNLDGIPAEYQNILNRNFSTCINEKIYFSKEQNKFVCDLTDSEKEKFRDSLIVKSFIEDFSEFSSILHKEEFKRNYNFYGFGLDRISSDWQFDNLNLDFENREITFNFSDQSLHIDAKVNFEINNSRINFNNFEILNVSANYDILNLKYYENFSNISKFLDKDFYDYEFEEIKKSEDFESSEIEKIYIDEGNSVSVR